MVQNPPLIWLTLTAVIIVAFVVSFKLGLFVASIPVMVIAAGTKLALVDGFRGS